MLVESLGFNLMCVSMLCDLDMLVVFGKYCCVVIMEPDKMLERTQANHDEMNFHFTRPPTAISVYRLMKFI